MACIRRRRNRWVVDWRDPLGKRRWVSCASRKEAETVLEETLREARHPARPTVDTNITFVDYARRWIGVVSSSVKPRTLDSYDQTLKLHLLPTFGSAKLRSIHSTHVKQLLA